MMSTVRKRLYTPDEYLEFENAAEIRHEYYRGEIFAMSGGTFEHVVIKDNLAFGLRNRFQGGPCRVLTSDMRVKVSPTGLYTYPDLVVVCEPPKFENRKVDQPKATLLNPNVIIEVLSKSTESYDRGDKFKQYRTLESLKEYILVSQTQPLVERYVRQETGWVLTDFFGLDALFTLSTIAVEIPLSAIYEGVEFPETPPRIIDEPKAD